jgi:hypothetical protein
MHEDMFELPRRSRWVKVTCVIPAESFVVFDEVRGRLEREYEVRHPVEQVQNGMVLEIVCAEWLAGAR